MVQGDGNDKKIEDTSSDGPSVTCGEKCVSDFPDPVGINVTYISTRRPFFGGTKRTVKHPLI